MLHSKSVPDWGKAAFELVVAFVRGSPLGVIGEPLLFVRDHLRCISTADLLSAFFEFPGGGGHFHFFENAQGGRVVWGEIGKGAAGE